MKQRKKILIPVNRLQIPIKPFLQKFYNLQKEKVNKTKLVWSKDYLKNFCKYIPDANVATWRK